FFSSRRRHTRSKRDWSSDVCSSDLVKSQVQRVELDVLADRKSPAREQKMRHVEEDLYFVLDERGHSVHLTDKGVETMSPEDPNLFVVPDISSAVHEIERD